MKRVVISGYYGFNNAGDEAIIHSLVTNLSELGRRRGEELSFTVFSVDPGKTARCLDVDAVPRTAPLQVLRSLLRCDVFISGGGGLLQDVTGRGLSIVYYLGLVVLARLLGRPVVFYAQGFGPVRSFFNRLLVRLVANRAAIITVRDQGSLDDLVALGVNRPALALTVDPVFMLEPAEEGTLTLPGLPEGKPVLGIAVRPWPGQERFLPEIAAAVNCLAAELNAAAVLVPMHYEEDLPICRELALLLRHPAVLLEQTLSPPEMARLFHRFDLVVAMRLHALIFAAQAGVPMLGVGYDRKVEAFLERIGQKPTAKPPELESADLVCQALELWAQRRAVTAELRARSAEFKNLARQTADDVLDFILSPRDVRLPRLLGKSGEAGLPAREEFLGLFADVVTLEQARDRVSAMLGEERCHFIASVNPEICLAAGKNKALRQAMQAADLGLPDGIGIVLASRLRGGSIRSRVTGIDLMQALVELAARESRSIYLYGAAEGVAAAAAAALAKRYPGLRVAGTQQGFVPPDQEEAVAAQIARSGAELVFVGLGSPRQEFFAERCGAATGARVLMVVGGSFDVLSGRLRRAPRFYQKLGLEWLFRLRQQPERLLRSLTLTKFLPLVLLAKKKY